MVARFLLVVVILMALAFAWRARRRYPAAAAVALASAAYGLLLLRYPLVAGAALVLTALAWFAWRFARR